MSRLAALPESRAVVRFLSGYDPLLLGAVFLLLLVLTFLSVAEMGLSRMSKPKAAAMAGVDPRRGAVLMDLVGQPERWVNPLLLAVNVCQTVQATLTGIVAARAFGAVGVVVGVVMNVVVFFVLAEAVPKTYAVLYPDRAALKTARGVRALVTFPPLRVVSGWLISLTNVIVKGKGLKQGPFVSEQELLGIVEAAMQDSVIEVEERDLIESIIEFGDTVAREVMTPYPDVTVVMENTTVSDALETAIERGFSRVPVMKVSEDDVVGVVFVKDLVRAERGGRGREVVTTCMREAHVIPESKLVQHLMRDMQAAKYHMAIVADEYGSIAGVVTLEDCLEELVGEITDEYDQNPQSIEHLEDGKYLVGGSVAVFDVNTELATNIPDQEWDSIGGFVFNTLGHVPGIGECVEYDGWRFTVCGVRGRRIVSICIEMA